MWFLLTFASVIGSVLGSGDVYCFWNHNSISRPDIGAYGISDLPLDLCTHMVYSFIQVNINGKLNYTEGTVTNNKSNKLEDFAALKKTHPKIKLLAAIGGWDEGSSDISAIAHREKRRIFFSNNVVSFAKKYDLDGIVFDWEFPGKVYSGADTDKNAFKLLLERLKTTLSAADLTLDVAVAPLPDIVDAGYDVEYLNNYADKILITLFDFHGPWENLTGVHTTLYPQMTDDDGPDFYLNGNDSLNYWLEAGVKKEKLVFGAASYARTFKLKSEKESSTRAPTDGYPELSVYTPETGVMPYYELCKKQDASDDTWVIHSVDDYYVYDSHKQFWAGYDNAESMKVKGAFAKSKGLSGVFLWYVDLDDHSKVCTTSTKKYPLLNALIEGYES